MTPAVLICVPCHNRRYIVEQCIPTVAAGMIRDSGRDILNLYNDGADQYGVGLLYDLGADNVHLSEPGIGIERQRKMHFLDFDPERFTHLYLTDSDALHDPNWRTELLEISAKYDNAPVCGYNTQAHARIEGNTLEDSPFIDDVIWRRVAPGISYLLTAAHVAKIVKALPMMPDHWNWDWTVPGLLGHQFAISRVGYVDHIGYGGMHHPHPEGLDGGDRVMNPTPWLVKKRAEVVKGLAARDDMQWLRT